MQSMAKILVVEDEKDIRDLIRVQLQTQGHLVDIVEDGDAAKELIHNPDYSLFIIDWMLPGTSGIELCQLIRKSSQTNETPILMITALTQPENIIQGLDAGADDYITKPFDMEVLQARVRAQLRRVQIQSAPERKIIQSKDLSIDMNKCKVTVKDEEINLTSTEFKILCLLAEKPGHVFTREQLISKILGDSVYVTNRTIDTHVAGLRKKLKEAADFVETIRGIGYRFKEDE